ncbi:hypothetical protein SAMN02745166_05013 [Prosthecobacter debontii]|uniref:Uncharacterized protein n=1 Tax=Prosthecobacter debontii TaxID=48467 RepID=A0A1T4Z4D3_9BACT|nr:hypothetical protein [Prosthecobacter debontii]SKB08733.1 hypothetical protein SAMN02745166_05013 [Prosthecobacter debontii]
MTQLELCNVALGHLGQARITALAEPNASARACELHYLPVLKEVLRSHRWNFAVVRVEVEADEDAPVFGWSKQYSLPEDCLRVLEVNDSEAGDWISEEWVIEGRKLLTNAAELRLIYLRDLEDAALTDPLFAQAFALKLAVALSETIRGSTGKTADLLTAYQNVTAPLARRVDANEGRRRKGMLPLNSLALRARWGGGIARP